MIHRIYNVPAIKWWALIPAANDSDVFDIPTRGRHNNWYYEGLGEYV